jgi:23S rRNA (guanosine2251-2'-O)-methyltransferase
MSLIFGINAVREAIRAGRAERVLVGARNDPRVRAVIEEAEARRVPVEQTEREVLDRQSGGVVHQGVAAHLRRARAWTVDQLVQEAVGAPLLVVLDGIEDPHNLGAILRSCDAAGVHGVIRQTRRAAALGGVAAKASAGAVAHVRVADVVNIARAIDELKSLHVWTVGLASDGPQAYDEVDLTVPLALVFGGEGPGLRRLVRESCDFLVRIPMLGHVESLNVSVAAGIVLFEALRQRRTGSPPG